MKKTAPEGITEAESELTRGLESLMLHVAKQEMAHLAMVSNLLLSVGGRPHFMRPNLPQAAAAYRPLPFTPQRFGEESLTRFIRADQPQPNPALVAVDIVPHPPHYGYTGELYRMSSAGFATVQTDLSSRGGCLFIGPAAGQAEGRWSTSISILAVRDLSSAQAAIREIVVEGEGATISSPNSHRSIFTRIKAGFEAALAANPSFEPAPYVADNPMPVAHPDATGPVNLIGYVASRQVAGLFNLAYCAMLALLTQVFDSRLSVKPCPP